MRALPEDLGGQDNIDWVPIDHASRIITEMMFNSCISDETGPQFFHIINPNAIRWKSILSLIKERLQKPRDLAVDILSFDSWVRKLQSTSGSRTPVSEDGASQGTSGLKLLEFYESMRLPERVGDEQRPASTKTRWELGRSLKASPRLGALEEVNDEWVAIWMDQWGY